jgi:hypothetical protein
MVEDIHRMPHSPDISRPAGITITACKLMLGPSKSRRSGREIRDIIILTISNSCKIDYLYLVSSIWGLSTKNIIHFYISVGDSLIVQILYSLANLQKYNSCDISNIRCPIFI